MACRRVSRAVVEQPAGTPAAVSTAIRDKMLRNSISEQVVEGDFQFRRCERPAPRVADIAVAPVARDRIAARVARAIKSRTGLHDEVPALREDPRIAVAYADAVGPPVISAVTVADAVIGSGGVQHQKVPDEIFVEPVSDAEL